MNNRLLFVAGAGIGVLLVAFLWPFFAILQWLMFASVVFAIIGVWGWGAAKLLHAYRGPWKVTVHDSALLYRDGQVRILDAQHPFPMVTTYSPHIAVPGVTPPAGTVDALPSAPRLPSAPPFAAIVREIVSGHLILGYNLTGQIAGEVTDLLSTAIAGRPGTGKTTLLRFVCAQVLKVGGRPILFDPHGSIADEVSGLLECAEDAPTMEHLAARLEHELDRRLAARRAGHPSGAPLLLLADEWPIISQLAPEAVRVAGRLVLEGRKVGMFALISGQGLPSEQLGGSLVRDALSSRYVFQTTTAQARMAGLDNETAKTLMQQLDLAGPGYAILASARRKPEVIAVPDTSPDDLRDLLEPGRILPPLPPNPALSATPAPVQPSKTPTPQERERERILAAIAQHPSASPSAICALAGISNNKVALVRQLLADSRQQE